MHRGYAGEILSSLSFVSRLNLSKSYSPLLVFNLLFLPFLDFFYLILEMVRLDMMNNQRARGSSGEAGQYVSFFKNRDLHTKI